MSHIWKKAFLLICLISLPALASCGSGSEFSDDEMIGKVLSVDAERRLLEVDISEWYKRGEGRSRNDLGIVIPIEATEQLVIRTEDGSSIALDRVKIGQKVLVNPPKDKKEGDYAAREVVLLEMTYEEKYGKLLSQHANKYKTTVFTEEGAPLPSETRERLMDVVPKSPISFGTYPDNFVTDYITELGIEKFPVMLVFDHQELVLKTYDPEELLQFFGVEQP